MMHCLDLRITNSSGHSLLHLAVILQNASLVKSLLAFYQLSTIEEKTSFLNIQDKNELTALHFACQLNHVDIVRLLLHAGAQPTIEPKFGNVLTTDTSILDLLDLYTHQHIKRKPLSRRPSVKSHMMHRFHSLSNTKSEEASTTTDDMKPPSMESDGLGLVRQKSDRRFYLFWLPVLICKSLLFFTLSLVINVLIISGYWVIRCSIDWKDKSNFGKVTTYS
jgi:hypothetical protein